MDTRPWQHDGAPATGQRQQTAEVSTPRPPKLSTIHVVKYTYALRSTQVRSTQEAHQTSRVINKSQCSRFGFNVRPSCRRTLILNPMTRPMPT